MGPAGPARSSALRGPRRRAAEQRPPPRLPSACGRSPLSPASPSRPMARPMARPPDGPPAAPWGRGGSQRPPVARRPWARLPSRRLETAARVRGRLAGWRAGGRAGVCGFTPPLGRAATGPARRLRRRPPRSVVWALGSRAVGQSGGRLPGNSYLLAGSSGGKCETDGWWQENNPGGGGVGAAPGFADAHLSGRAGVFRDSAPAEPRGLAAKEARDAALSSAGLFAEEGSAHRMLPRPPSSSR